MMKKNKTARIALSSLVLLMIAAVGVNRYRNAENEKQMETTPEEVQETNEVSMEEAQAEHIQELDEIPEELKNYPFVRDEIIEEEIPQEEKTEQQEEQSEQKEQLEQEEQPVQEEEPAVENTGAPVADFSEDSVLTWPVSGEVLVDYSMDGSVYFSTLDQYKYNEGLVMNAEVGDSVQAAANGKITMIKEDPRTGLTITMNMGNGYETIYGQMKDIAVEEGQMVAQGTVLGQISEPTKYFVKEGPNLYFAMKKDDKFVDPLIYTADSQE